MLSFSSAIETPGHVCPQQKRWTCLRQRIRKVAGDGRSAYPDAKTKKGISIYRKWTNLVGPLPLHHRHVHTMQQCPLLLLHHCCSWYRWQSLLSACLRTGIEQQSPDPQDQLIPVIGLDQAFLDYISDGGIDSVRMVAYAPTTGGPTSSWRQPVI